MTIIITILYIIHINVIMIMKLHVDAWLCKKKTKKIERERENNEKTMLYIFRYFKEIQKGIFVIKTMFETVLFGLIYVVLNLVRTFYTFSFFVPFLFGAILKQQVALLYQSSPASLLLSLLQKEFWFAHMCCVFFFWVFFVPLWRLYLTKRNTEVFCLKRF